MSPGDIFWHVFYDTFWYFLWLVQLCGQFLPLPRMTLSSNFRRFFILESGGGSFLPPLLVLALHYNGCAAKVALFARLVHDGC